MNPVITIPETAVYADEAPGSLVVPPNTSQFHQGVEPEMTLPAAWWNYFVRLFTETNIQASADLEAILTELNNLLIAYGYTPDAELNNQLSTLFGRFLYGDNPKGTTKLTTGSLNDIARSGFYQYVTATEYPGTLSEGLIVHAQFSDTIDSAIQFALGPNGNTWFRAKVVGTWQAWARLWSSANDGEGSGLDADFLHGKEFTAYSQVGPDGWPLIKGPVYGQVAQVGQGLTITGIDVSGPAITALNDTDVAVIWDQITTNVVNLAVFRWNGSTWTQLGTTQNISTVINESTCYITALNNTDVVISKINASGNRHIVVYRWNSIALTWSQLGTAFIHTNPINAILAMSPTMIVGMQLGGVNSWFQSFFWDPINYTWTASISSAVVTNANYPALTKLTASTFAFIDGTVGQLRVYRNNGSNWVVTGTTLTLTTNNLAAIAALNETDIMFVGMTSEILRLYRWNTVTLTWSAIGTGVTIAGIEYPALTALNHTDVAFVDSILENLRVYKCI